MYIINVLALVWFAVSVTIICVGSNSSDGDTIAGGFFILIALICMSLAFHVGVAWQTIDIKEKYILIEKKKPF